MSSQAELFRARADDARAEAQAATLDNVRDRAIRSAEAWEAMAARATRGETMRAKIEAEKAAVAQ